MTETSNYWAVPAWLQEAWETGRTYSGYRRGDPLTDKKYLIEEILKVHARVLKGQEWYDMLRKSGQMDQLEADLEQASFDLWRFNGLLANLGWLEVRRAIAQGETNRTENGDQPS